MAVGKAIFVLLIANLYGPRGQGIVTLGLSVMVGGALFLGLGTDLANTYLIGKSPSRLGQLKRASALLSLAVVIVAAVALLFAFTWFGDTLFRDLPAEGRLPLVLLVGIQVYHLQIQGLTVGIGDFRPLVVANALQYALLNAGVVLSYLGGLSVVLVLYLWAGGLIFKTFYLLARLPPATDETDEGLWEVLSDLVRNGRQMMLGNLANLLNFRLDAYFIAYYLPATHLGWYAAASMIAEGTLYLPKALGHVVLSWASTEREEDRSKVDEKLRNIFLTASYSLFLLIILIEIALRPLVALLFGEPFLPALEPSRILLVASFFYGVGLVAMNLIYGFGNPGWNTRAGMIAAGVNALGNLYAIPRWGIQGAAWASLLSYSVYFLLSILNVKRYLPQERNFLYLLLPDRRYFADLRLKAKQLMARSPF